MSHEDLEDQLDEMLKPFAAHLTEREAKPEPLVIRKQPSELDPSGNVLVVLKNHRPIVIFNSWDMQSDQEQRRMLKNALTNETGLAAVDAVAKAIQRKLTRGISVSVGVHKGSYVLGKATGAVARQKKTAKGQQKQTARISQRKLGAMRRVKVPQPHGEAVDGDFLAAELDEILSGVPDPFDLGAPAIGESQNVAVTILNQMGGWNRIRAMTGAKHVVTTDGGKGVKFQFPNKKRSKGNVVHIVLTARDDYDVEFFSATITDYKSVKKYSAVPAENLARVFSKQTGLALKL